MVSILWAAKADALRAGVTSAKVLQLFIDRTYQRQAEKHRGQRLGESTRFMLLTIAERAYFMTGIAAHMAAQRLKNQITRDDLETLIERLYEEMPDQELAKQAQPALDEPTTPLKTRIHDRPDALEALKTDVRTYGLLVRDPSRQNAYRFPHKSYLEVLFADFAFELLTGTHKWSANTIKAATGAQLSDLTGMPESVSFLADILSANAPESAEDELFKALALSQAQAFRIWPLRAMRFLCEKQKVPANAMSSIGHIKAFDFQVGLVVRLYVVSFVMLVLVFLSGSSNFSDTLIVMFALCSVLIVFFVFYFVPRVSVRVLVRSEGYQMWQVFQGRLRKATAPTRSRDYC